MSVFFFLVTEARSFELYIKHAFSCEGIVAKELISLCLPHKKNQANYAALLHHVPYFISNFKTRIS